MLEATAGAGTAGLARSLRDSKAARWTALAICSFTMLCGYYVADVMSPLKTLIEQQLHWTSSEYGFFTGAYGSFNVFLGMLVFGGIILDKAGARFAGVLATVLMVVGCAAKYWAVSTPSLAQSAPLGVNGQVLVAALGFAVFGVGIELIGITATKIIARWFKGYEIALAMGLQVGTARIGTALALGLGAPIAVAFGAVSAPVLFGLILLVVGLVAYTFYCALDARLDRSESSTLEAVDEADAFHLKDIGSILGNRAFWYLALLCAMFYSAVFPFLKYASDLMVQKYGVDESWAGLIPSILPFATIPLTVVFGSYYDRKGKGATLMLIGSLLLVAVHLTFAIPFLSSWVMALLATIVLGFGFSLVPAAMWPSVPRFMPHRQLGTAYALIFFLQNLVALMGIPYLIGWVLERFCIVGQRVTEEGTSPAYNYTLPMLLFTACGVLAVVFALLLKAEDRKKGYGLERPAFAKPAA
ncbi:MAG: MFS transporter [Acidobacteria bacterium]|nr:MFS transporter [Acidobacteriota bacterium]